MPSPLYSQYLDFAPTFRWGGREYGAGDEAIFRRKLGKRYGRWARNHPTASRVFDPVEQEIYGAYQPELRSLERARQAEAARYDRLMRNLGGFYGALGGMFSGAPGAMSDLYNTGADTMRGGGDMYGAVMNAEQGRTAAADNALLGDINSPAQIEGGDGGSVLAGAAGWIPATMMGEQGAAWSDRMKHLPTEAALQANLIMKDLVREAGDSDKEFSEKITDILSGISGDRMKLRSSLEEQRLSKLKADRDYALKQAAMALAAGKQKDYLYWKRKAYQLDLQQEHRYSNKDKGLDIDGNPLPGYHIGPNGTVVKDKKPKGSKSGGVDWGDLQKDIASETLTKKGVDPNRPWAGETDIPMTYKEAFKMLWAKYSGMVKNKGKLRRLINQILASNGIKKPSQSGSVDPYGGNH